MCCLVRTCTVPIYNALFLVSLAQVEAAVKIDIIAENDKEVSLFFAK